MRAAQSPSKTQTRPAEVRVQSLTHAEAIELADEEDLHELSASAGTQTARGQMVEEAEARRRLTIAEAFADDDVLAEFREEKRALEDEEQPKSVDLTLPGWGEWAGVFSIKRIMNHLLCLTLKAISQYV